MVFKEQTTIVLGAGASCDYGYPLGDDLIKDIINNKIGNEELSNKIKEALIFYDPTSIDAFLWHYESIDKEFVVHAKQIISKIILSCGDIEQFKRGALNRKRYPDEKQDKCHWYRFLWDAIVAGLTPEKIANPRHRLNFNIITFNYDTSLEYFLYTRVMDRNSMFNDEQKKQMLAKLSKHIHHVYGSIMEYEWCGGKDDNKILNYRTQLEIRRGALTEGREHQIRENEVIKLAREKYSNIKLISGRSERTYENFQETILNSRQIIFLGFGFDDTNIGPTVLDLKKTFTPIHGGKKIVKYTNYGDSEIINNKLQKLNLNGTSIELKKSTKKVYQALEQDFSLTSIDN